MVILAEEVASQKLTIFDITKQICDAVQARAEQDKNHGVILLPEGLIESIPEVYALLQLQEIHSLLRQGVSVDKISTQYFKTFKDTSNMVDFQSTRYNLSHKPLGRLNSKRIYGDIIPATLSDRRLVCSKTEARIDLGKDAIDKEVVDI